MKEINSSMSVLKTTNVNLVFTVEKKQPFEIQASPIQQRKSTSVFKLSKLTSINRLFTKHFSLICKKKINI